MISIHSLRIFIILKVVQHSWWKIHIWLCLAYECCSMNDCIFQCPLCLTCPELVLCGCIAQWQLGKPSPSTPSNSSWHSWGNSCTTQLFPRCICGVDRNQYPFPYETLQGWMHDVLTSSFNALFWFSVVFNFPRPHGQHSKHRITLPFYLCTHFLNALM